MKTYIINTAQSFYIEAESEEEAQEKYENGMNGESTDIEITSIGVDE